MTETSKPASDNAYSIGAVARLTGISTHALRIWERRYGSVIAGRTETGRRVYSRRDVEKLSLLKLLVDHGFSIGQIADLSLAELREQHAEVSGQVSAMQELGNHGELSVAVLAGFSIDRLRAYDLPDRIRFSIIESEYSRFRSSIKQLQPDILLLEYSVVDAECLRRIADLRAVSRAKRIVVLFKFAHRNELAELAASKIELLRSPATMTSLVNTLLSGGTFVRSTQTRRSGNSASQARELMNEDIPARRFSEADLIAVSKMSTAIDCECPAYMSELIQSLVAFEVYSEQCEVRNQKDRALHHYLQGATARARAMMEDALQTLLIEEKLQV